MQLECLKRKLAEHPVEAGVTLISLIIFATLGATLGPYRTSITIMALLLLYILLQGAPASTRIIPLAAALATHLAAVATYYSNPLPLPLLILERSPIHGYSINIDIVQIALLYETRQILKDPPQCPAEPQYTEHLETQPENSKTPEENTGEPGGEAPR